MARRIATQVWRHVLLYGLLMSAGALALQWLDYQRLVRTRADDVYVFLIAAAFLAMGVYIGARVVRPAPVRPFDGNPEALATLGISPRELTVLEHLAAGRSNKEIATHLHVSPHTVKTHVARLLDKLEAKRRSDAVARARALGILR